MMVHLELYINIIWYIIFSLAVEYRKLLYIRMNLHGGSSFIAMSAPAIYDNSHMSKFYWCSNASWIHADIVQ